MNPRLGLLQPYPFERLRKLLAGATPPPGLRPISLSIGEPQHPTPALIKDALVANLGGLSRYPQTLGLPELRAVLAAWIARRHGLGSLDAEREVIPVSGSREALFAIAQAVLDPAEAGALVVCPNPFYQIYEGAALLGGAQPHFVNALARDGFRPDWDAVPEAAWQRTQPALRLLAGKSHRARDDARGVAPPVRALGPPWLRHRLRRVLLARSTSTSRSRPWARSPRRSGWGARATRAWSSFGQLSKRSNAPGLRSGFVAGDRAVLEPFVLYRTYHGAR